MYVLKITTVIFKANPKMIASHWDRLLLEYTQKTWFGCSHRITQNHRLVVTSGDHPEVSICCFLYWLRGNNVLKLHSVVLKPSFSFLVHNLIFLSYFSWFFFFGQGRGNEVLLAYSILLLYFDISIISSRFGDYFYVIGDVCYDLLSIHKKS